MHRRVALFVSVFAFALCVACSERKPSSSLDVKVIHKINLDSLGVYRPYYAFAIKDTTVLYDMASYSLIYFLNSEIVKRVPISRFALSGGLRSAGAMNQKGDSLVIHDYKSDKVFIISLSNLKILNYVDSSCEKIGSVRGLYLDGHKIYLFGVSKNRERLPAVAVIGRFDGGCKVTTIPTNLDEHITSVSAAAFAGPSSSMADGVAAFAPRLNQGHLFVRGRVIKSGFDVVKNKVTVDSVSTERTNFAYIDNNSRKYAEVNEQILDLDANNLIVRCIKNIYIFDYQRDKYYKTNMESSYNMAAFIIGDRKMVYLDNNDNGSITMYIVVWTING
jgi:hypothetical protein